MKVIPQNAIRFVSYEVGECVGDQASTGETGRAPNAAGGNCSSRGTWLTPLPAFLLRFPSSIPLSQALKSLLGIKKARTDT